MEDEALSNTSRLRIVFMGTPEPSAVTLRAVVSAGFDVTLAVTMPDRPRKRGGHREPSPLKAAATGFGIPVFQPADINSDEALARIAGAEPDVLFIVAYGRLLKRPLLEVSRLFPVNLHFSLLPRYRGAAPVAWAIARGEKETGATIQRIRPRMDSGPILSTAKVEIGPEETTGELLERLSGVGARLTVETLTAIERGEHVETPQDHTLATKAPKLKKADGRMDWSRPAVELARHVRAMTPWPGATTVFRAEARRRDVPVTLLRTSVLSDEDADGPSGEVIRVDAEGILVQSGEGRLLIRELKPAGKRAMVAREFANGYRAAPGDVFQSPEPTPPR